MAVDFFNHNLAKSFISGTRSRPRQEEDVDLVTVYTDVYNMRIELEKMKKPIGTRDSPARSCKDLLFGHPQLKDGYYWIDPNLGMNDDAVKVYCSMSTGRSNPNHGSNIKGHQG